MNHPRKNVIEEIEWGFKNNFDFIDLTYEPPSNEKLDPKETSDLLKKYELEAVGHTNPNLPAIFPIKEIRDSSIRELKKAARFFKDANIKKMNIHPFYYHHHSDAEEKFQWNIEVLKSVNQYCQELEIELMLENYFHPFESVDNFLRIVKLIPDLKVHLDIGHLNVTSEDITEDLTDFFTEFGDRIIHLHAHDNHKTGDEHLPIGCGTIKWPSIVKILKSFGYNKTITLEVFSHDRDYLIMSKNKLKNLWDKT